MSYKLQTPWFEQPWAKDILCHYMQTTKEEWELCNKFIEDGYVIIDLPSLTHNNISMAEGSQGEEIEGTSWADDIKEDITNHVESKDYKAQEDGYHYSESPRVFEAWRWSSAVLELARHPKILSTLRMLYQSEPIPFQTINFMKGSNQPLHSDTIHFHTLPALWVAGCWVALEDMDCFNGTLAIVPGSHKLPVYDFEDLSLPKAEYGKQFQSYRIYEQFIKDLMVAHGLKVKGAYLKKGQAILWRANFCHGGSPIIDQTRTRWSQAIHYTFSNAKITYGPMFSLKSAGDYAIKDLSQKDILNWKI